MSEYIQILNVSGPGLLVPPLLGIVVCSLAYCRLFLKVERVWADKRRLWWAVGEAAVAAGRNAGGPP